MKSSIASETESLFKRQLTDWELSKKNYLQLAGTVSRRLHLGDFEVILQYNPERIRSASARTDTKSLSERPCFLCRKNRPKEQESIGIQNKYEILVNPYPVFPRHLTIAAINHVEQRIADRFADMAEIAVSLPDYVIFYNGAKCGASAPDHMHFQAAEKGYIPLPEAIDQGEISKKEIKRIKEAVCYELCHNPLRCLIIESVDIESLKILFNRIYQSACSLSQNEPEPMMNVLCWSSQNKTRAAIILRKGHRPWQYYDEGENNILISPASVEMGGLFVLALEKDYTKLMPDDLVDILNQALISDEEMNHVIQQL